MRSNCNARFAQSRLPNCSLQRGEAGRWGRRLSLLPRLAKVLAKCGLSPEAGRGERCQRRSLFKLSLFNRTDAAFVI